MSQPCACKRTIHAPKLVVLTGGPGAGKTAALAVLRRHFCDHVEVLPESASILFGGGFPRRATAAGQRAAQRGIYRVQVELERMVVEEARAGVVLCDRGTVDGLAYWPGTPASYWAAFGTTYEAELARYATVIHLRTPGAAQGYNHENPVRTEDPAEAGRVDDRILDAWSGHPRRFVVDSTPRFLDKLADVVALVRSEVPPCCRVHEVAELAALA